MRRVRLCDTGASKTASGFQNEPQLWRGKIMKKWRNLFFLGLLLIPALSVAGNTTISGYATDPQPVYLLSGDHRFHLGEFYSQDAFQEWHYLTLPGKDLDTGEDISFFWCIFQTAFDPKREHPYNSVILAGTISYTDQDFIEGCAYIRSGSPDGPIVGTGFVEIVDSHLGYPA